MADDRCLIIVEGYKGGGSQYYNIKAMNELCGH